MRNVSHSRWSHDGGSYPTKTLFNKHRKEKGHKKPLFIPCNSNDNCNKYNDQKLNTCFRWGSEDQFNANCPKM